MKCPECGLIDSNCRVIDSRPFKNTIKRRRVCSFCNHKWNTYEIDESKFEFLASRDKTGRRDWTELEELNLVKMKEDGKTYKEISNRLGRTYGSVKARVNLLLSTGDYFGYMDEVEKVPV